MAHAYVSPPRSPTSSRAESGSIPSTSTSAAVLAAALSQPPPPTLREILSAYAAQGRGDREMLIALLKAKAAEDQKITSIAQLQQQVLRVQMTAFGAQAQQNQSDSTTNPAPTKTADTKSVDSSRDGRRSPVSPTPPKRHRSRTPVHVRAHPYAHSRTPSRETDKSFWAVMGRGLDVNVSDERTTSDEAGTAVDH
ncbi:hypothetical protein ACGC1H_006160 [Rhizoctonia solani]|uniref:Uncharacterized protein n=1 Tax=Rhizoctonia solani TaxID=456999 RepID=A0A8H2X702_9AGAM|nr:unnamed protein product [Rhizoctonia solani]